MTPDKIRKPVNSFKYESSLAEEFFSYLLSGSIFQTSCLQGKNLARKRRGFLFLDRAELSQARTKNKKTQADGEGGCRVFSLGCYLKRIMK